MTHRESLLHAGLRLFYLHGFNGTRVDVLLAEADVPKGSFYHHFGSKESFAMAVLERYDDHQARLLREWAGRTDLPVPTRLAGYHRSMRDGLIASGWARACLLGRLSNEMAGSSESFRERMKDGFGAWRDALSDLIREGQTNGEVVADVDADALATAVLVMVEGGFVAALACRERSQLDAVTDALTDLLTVPTVAENPPLSDPGEKRASRMPPPEASHRDSLLREGRRQIFDHGYNAMTVDGLLAATGVPKGSFYHHFGSKEGFARAVLQEYGGFQQAKLAAWAARDDLGTAARLRGYFEELAAIVVGSGFRHTDLAGKLATEISATNEPLRLQVAEVVQAWRRQLELILVEGQDQGDVRAARSAASLSAAVHALADGAFMVGAATHDERSLVAVGDAIERLVRATD